MEILKPQSWVFIVIFALVVLWLLGIVILFVKLLKKYTLKDWGEEKNPYQGETFAMPRGVMRGTLTLSLLFIVMLMEVVNLAIGGDGIEGKINQLMVAFQMMLAFYFGSKVMHHVTGVDKKKAQLKAITKEDLAQSDQGAVG